MTKTVHPVLKKTGAVLLTVLVLVLVAVPAFAVALPDAPTGYVYDGANVLSSSTESYIERTGSALAEACGAEVVVATVDFTDGEDIADYAYDLFNKWGIGDKKANNGLLILLSIGAEDYYAEPGVGLTDVFTGGVLDAMLYDYLEGAPPPPPPMGGFWRGPRPPRGPGGPGFGGPRPGGFSGSRPSGGPRPGGGRSGGFGSGRSGGGAPRAGGGSTHGGGAGRRR